MALTLTTQPLPGLARPRWWLGKSCRWWRRQLCSVQTNSFKTLGKDLSFGGKLFIGLGDFLQVAPVVRSCSGPSATLNSSIRTSPLSKRFNILRLIIQVQQARDPVYAWWIIGGAVNLYKTSVSLWHLKHPDGHGVAPEFTCPHDFIAVVAEKYKLLQIK